MTSASTGPHQFSMAGWISPAPFETLLHITIVEAADGESTLTMPFLIDYAQGAGLMHGGALVSLADTAVVMAIKSLLAPGSHFATIRLETNFLHPVKKGMVTAKAKVASRVDRIIEGRATIYDEDHRAVMEFTSTFKLARDTRIQGITFADLPPAVPPSPEDPQ
jgi:acyl-CoA thioesterase